MGCCASKKKPAGFEAVEAATGMSAKEVMESYKAFRKEAGAEKVKLDRFTKIVAGMNTNKGGNVDEYARHLFRVLDADRDGLVSFSECVVGFHNLSQSAGDNQEKLKMVFKMYDVEGKNAISQDNVKTITRAQYRLEGRPVDGAEVESRCKALLAQCDLDDDGRITQEEFMRAGASVAEMFELED